MPTQQTSSASPCWAVSGALRTFLSSFTASAGWSFPPGRSVTDASPLFLEVYDAADGLAAAHQVQRRVRLLHSTGPSISSRAMLVSLPTPSNAVGGTKYPFSDGFGCLARGFASLLSGHALWGIWVGLGNEATRGRPWARRSGQHADGVG